MSDRDFRSEALRAYQHINARSRNLPTHPPIHPFAQPHPICDAPLAYMQTPRSEDDTKEMFRVVNEVGP